VPEELGRDVHPGRVQEERTPVDLAQFGAVGPKGETGDPGQKGDPGTARAYACAISIDGTSVTPCSDRPSKGVVTIMANTAYPGATCFQLDPSIDANSATVIASLNQTNTYSGGKVNALIGADGYANYNGCPPNSVLVTTARHTNGGAFLGIEDTILGVNILVP
jgi:hypothetical protein